jgi:predicted Zn-dependent protease
LAGASRADDGIAHDWTACLPQSLRSHRSSLAAPGASRRSLAALLALLTLAAGCAVNPATGKREISFVSRSKELEMGRQGDQEILAEFGAYEDTALSAYVERVGRRLAAVCETPELDWHFRVLNAPVVNAFALPGGYVYVTRGMLAAVQSEAQLAGILGHEIGHVTARHTAQRVTQSTIAQIGLGVGTLLVPGLARYGQEASTGLALLLLKYSRDDETQADELGIRYSVRAGYDPREIPSTYETLRRLAARQVTVLPNFLSTHPDPGDRKERTTSLSEAAAAANPAAREVGREQFLVRVDGLVYGHDPREGFVENGVFYHPGLAFELIFPLDWEIVNSASALLATAPSGSSAIQLTIVPSAGTRTPDEFVALGRTEGEILEAEKWLSKVGEWTAWAGPVRFARVAQGEALFAAWVSREEGRYYQFLALPQDAETRDAFRQTLWTFRELTKPELLARRPDRVAVERVEGSARPLTDYARGFDRLAVPVEEVALLNNLEERSVVSEGQPIKLVLKAEP